VKTDAGDNYLDEYRVDLIDRIVISFGADAKPAPVLEKKSPGGAQLYIEITELTRHICMSLHPTGIQRCVCEVVAALKELGLPTRVFFFRPMDEDPASMSASAFLEVIHSPEGIEVLKSIVYGDKPICSYYGVQTMQVSKEDIVILMDVFWTQPERKVSFLDACRCTKMLFVHDLIPMILDNEPAPNKIFAPSLRAISQKVDGFACNSNFTHRHLLHYLNFTGLNEKYSTTVQLAAEIPTTFSVFSVASEPDFRTSLILEDLRRRNYILSVSSLSERKRIVELAQAFIDATSRMLDDWYLVIVGGDPGNNPVLSEKLRALCAVSNGRIIWLKGPSDYQLKDLYESCDFVAYTSTFEGWGLPVGEALAHGKPVVAHRESSIPEVGGEKVYYCEPGHRHLTEALQRLMLDEKLRCDLTEKISVKELRTWREVANELYAAALKLRLQVLSNSGNAMQSEFL